MKTLQRWAAMAAASALLAACGGGGSDTTPAAAITSVKVMGDSLADVGTFYGVKFTVQGTASKVFPELVAQSYGVNSLCPFFTFTGTTFAPNSTAGCTSYAIGGSTIIAANGPYAANDPRGIGLQLQTAASVGYAAGDLLVIDGGSNDIMALITAYFDAATGDPVKVGAYATLLGTLLDATTVNTNLAAGAAGFANLGGLYMAALADTFHGQIKTYALDAGAPRAAVLNLPAITKTPRFQGVLDQVALKYGGGSAGAQARAQTEAVIDGWAQVFNARLATQFAGNAKVVVVDFYTAVKDEVAAPTQYGLDNASTPACPLISDNAVTLFSACTDTSLSAAPPTGVTDPTWWKRYAFADGIHPTPYGHQLMSQLVARSLAQAGWL